MSKFKITLEHQAVIKAAIDNVLAKYPNIVQEYEQGNFARSDRVKDLQTRFNFDLIYGTGLSSWLCDNIYSYANDNHMASFLKSICPTVTRNY